MVTLYQIKVVKNAQIIACIARQVLTVFNVLVATFYHKDNIAQNAVSIIVKIAHKINQETLAVSVIQGIFYHQINV